ncbi:MAG: 2-dehydropantoate 2-reductase, partial [Deltaproteobacteria bacterium]|nr:2-dehydropantoate 2-reductase [Deltaproteobacteria bacterium]
MQKIAVIGAGAVGCGLGFLLTRAGRQVTLIGRPDQVEVIRNHGLRVEGYAGEHTVAIPAAERLDFTPDLVLLAVKTQDVAGALRENQTFIAGAPVVTMQNGVRSDDLAAELLPRKQILSAVVLLHANYLAPGSVTLMYEGGLIVGRPFGPRDVLLEQTAVLLNQALPTRISDNIRGAHWLKLITNLNNALPALIDGTFHQVYGDPDLASLAIRIMREGLKTAQKAGIRLESLPNISVGLTRLINFLPVALAARVAAVRVEKMKTPWPLLGSTLQSLRRRRSTEIDYLNGE